MANISSSLENAGLTQIKHGDTDTQTDKQTKTIEFTQDFFCSVNLNEKGIKSILLTEQHLTVCCIGNIQ